MPPARAWTLWTSGSLERYDGGGPLAATIAMAGLGPAEALVLVAAVAPFVDERFAAAYATLTDRPGVTGLTGEVARTLAARTLAGRLDVTALLSEAGTLRATGLLTLDPPDDLSGTLAPDPPLLAWLLAQPPPPPRVSSGFPARPLTTVHTLPAPRSPTSSDGSPTANASCTPGVSGGTTTTSAGCSPCCTGRRARASP